jgi:hypothetical protein
MKHGLSVAKKLLGRLLAVAVIITVSVVVATRWPQRLPKSLRPYVLAGRQVINTNVDQLAV